MIAEYLINCSWDQMEYLNSKAGFFMPPDSRTMRTKVIIEIEIPPDSPLRESHSLFFSFGPHCSFTNCGNGRGYISYEPVTNIEQTTAYNLSEKSKRLVYSEVSPEEIKHYGKGILAGVTQYIPGLKDAKIIGAKFGVVKTNGLVNIYSADSKHHKRVESGVEELQNRLINNACMKLLYFIDNAKEVGSLAAEHIEIAKSIDAVMTKINYIISNPEHGNTEDENPTPTWKWRMTKTDKKNILYAVLKNLQRNSSSKEVCGKEDPVARQILKAIEAKKAALDELRNPTENKKHWNKT